MLFADNGLTVRWREVGNDLPDIAVDRQLVRGMLYTEDRHCFSAGAVYQNRDIGNHRTAPVGVGQNPVLGIYHE
ncbi:hypothetical protein CLE01_10920 [Cryobacterium levicorallinum]|nr:hypothetical protein CLE01_10920 [Cryobacterium levicorallinum]